MIQEKRKVLIVTTDSTLAYQPTLLNLYHELKEHFDISIVSFCYYNNFIPAKGDYKVQYLKIPRFQKKLLFLFNRIGESLINPILKVAGTKLAYRNDLFKALVSATLRRYLEQTTPDEVIAVDFQALSVCQAVFGRAHFLSLEIYPHDKFRKQCDFRRIRSVIISSEERYEHLFGSQELRRFIIQNAPIHKQYELVPITERHGLIWAGTIDLKFGVQYVIDFIRNYPQYSLTLKGPFVTGLEDHIRSSYQELISEGRLIINKTYLENDEFIRFISGHEIAFCFYDWEVIRNNINYYLGNAGRLFMYFAASVPTIACNTPGLKSVRDFNAGRLIDDYQPDTIKKAIDEIKQHYETIAENCLKASEHFSFDKMTAPLIEYLNDTKKHED